MEYFYFFKPKAPSQYADSSVSAVTQAE